MLKLAVSLVAVVLTLSACGTGAEETLSQVDKADTVALEAALHSAAVAQESLFAQGGAYATDTAQLKANGMNVDPSITITVVSAAGEDYCMEATKAGLDATWHVMKAEGVPAEGGC